jgi:hypothetical protein
MRYFLSMPFYLCATIGVVFTGVFMALAAAIHGDESDLLKPPSLAPRVED